MDERVHGSPRERQPQTAGPEHFSLVGISGPYLGKRFRIPPGVTRIGRDTEYNHVVLEDDRVVSKRHATITSAEGKLTIRDENSLKGTFVNNIELRATDSPIRLGDELWIGRSIFRLVAVGAWDFAPPKRAGFRYMRLAWPAAAAVAALATIATGFLLFRSLADIVAIRSRPGEPEFSTALAGSIEEHYPGPVVADLDADHRLDYVLGAADELQAYSGSDHQVLWKEPARMGAEIQGTPGVGDIDGDGIVDLAVSWYGDPQRSGISLISGASGGEIDSKSPFPGAARPCGSPVVADPDNDGFADVIEVGAGRSKDAFAPDQASLVAYRNKGGFSGMWQHDPRPGAIGPHAVFADADGDGRGEAIVSGGDSHVMIYDWGAHWSDAGGVRTVRVDALVSEKAGVNRRAEVKGPVAVGEVDQEGTRAIVGVTRDGFLFAVRGDDPDECLWCVPLGDGLGSYPRRTPAPLLIDFYGEGRPAVVALLASDDQATLYAYRTGMRAGKAEALLSWRCERESAGLIGGLAAADLDKDGAEEIILVTGSGDLLVVRAPSGGGAEKLWQGSGFSSEPAVCDLDGDRRLEIVSRDGVGSLATVETNVACPRWLVIWDPARKGSCPAGAFLGWPSTAPLWRSAGIASGGWLLTVGVIAGLYVKRRVRISRALRGAGAWS